jgi:hypothetical protein
MLVRKTSNGINFSRKRKQIDAIKKKDDVVFVEITFFSCVRAIFQCVYLINTKLLFSRLLGK